MSCPGDFLGYLDPTTMDMVFGPGLFEQLFLKFSEYIPDYRL